MPSESKGVALVTGAAQGIGRAIALRLASDGFDVALNDIPACEAQLNEFELEISAKGCRACSVVADVSVEEEVKGMIEAVVKQLGGLDVLVANAGIFRMGTLLSTAVEDFDAMFAVNARGTHLCYKYAAMQMIAQGRGGRIIGASSKNGKRGLPDGTGYGATKFAIRGLTQAAALELGRHRITVNCYAPGGVDTAMMRMARSQRAQDPEAIAFAKRLPTKLLPAVGYDGQVEDVASIVSYLVSKEAHFITGECALGQLDMNISVDGGIMLS
ncbi:NAD(P)-binding protein [Leucogyrophana mollusca]|uniref:NAD(P)-binding protein n=1 Tax=Leucogyrophana mollusca TaxID=85980 RepID=A0ACB8BX01_9AGAM|nr:NAD(P)-binding protein [Leucogyrophana mollusca]